MAKKGQTFNQYSEDLKREAVRLYESGVSSREVARQLNIRQKGQVLAWVTRHQSSESFEDKCSHNTCVVKGRPKTMWPPDI
jgi:transposase